MASSPTVLTNRPIGPIGFGTMRLTWARTNPNLPTQAEAFEVLDAAIAAGATFFNGGEVYAHSDDDYNSCDLLREYLTAKPENADKIVLSIKGGAPPGTMAPDGSMAEARRSVEACVRKLAGTKKIDIFEYARVDPKTPIEETMGHLQVLVDEGLIGAVGLSEVRASTIERAHKITPIAAVEVEVSLWTTDVLRNGVAETCARLGIPIVAYSPLMYGALGVSISGEEKGKASKPANLERLAQMLPKFQGDALAQNLRLNDEIAELASHQGVTPPQIAINWVRSLSGRRMKVLDAQGAEKEVVMPTVVPIPGSTKPERVKENSKMVELGEEGMGELQVILDRNPIVSITPTYIT